MNEPIRASQRAVLFAGGAAVVDGTAAVQGSATVGMTASVLILAAATVLGGATFQTAPLVQQQGSSSVQGGATVAMTGLVIQKATATVQGGATVGLAGSPLVLGTATVPGGATVSLSGINVEQGTAAVSGSSTLGMGALVMQQAAATVVGAATMTVDGDIGGVVSGTAVVQGGATVGVAGLVLEQATAVVQGAATFETAPLVQVQGGATVPGGATFEISLVPPWTAVARPGASRYATVLRASRYSSRLSEPRSEPLVGMRMVRWTNLDGVADMGGGVIRRIRDEGTLGGAGAVSVQQALSGWCAVELTYPTTQFPVGGIHFGLSNGDTDGYADDIDFAFSLAFDPKLGGCRYSMMEFGVEVYSGVFSPGDTFRVCVELAPGGGGDVVAMRAGGIVYISGVAPTYPLLVDTSIDLPDDSLGPLFVDFGDEKTVVGGSAPTKTVLRNSRTQEG